MARRSVRATAHGAPAQHHVDRAERRVNRAERGGEGPRADAAVGVVTEVPSAPQNAREAGDGPHPSRSARARRCRRRSARCLAVGAGRGLPRALEELEQRLVVHCEKRIAPMPTVAWMCAAALRPHRGEDRSTRLTESKAATLRRRSARSRGVTAVGVVDDDWQSLGIVKAAAGSRHRRLAHPQVRALGDARARMSNALHRAFEILLEWSPPQGSDSIPAARRKKSSP